MLNIKDDRSYQASQNGSCHTNATLCIIIIVISVIILGALLLYQTCNNLAAWFCLAASFLAWTRRVKLCGVRAARALLLKGARHASSASLLSIANLLAKLGSSEGSLKLLLELELSLEPLLQPLPLGS